MNSKDYVSSFQKVIEDSFDVSTYEKLDEIARKISILNGKIFLCGNGGSMSDAAHFGAELSGRFKKDRRPYKVIVLGSNQSSMSAIANDYGYDNVFLRELYPWDLNKNDILFCFSTSGNSPNVVSVAKLYGEHTIVSLTGNNDCPLDKYSDISLKVVSDYTPYIQQIHQIMYHYICLKIDEYHRGNAERIL